MTTLDTSRFSEKLKQAIQVGMVTINPQTHEATILAPPEPENLDDEDWLAIIGAASEMHRELAGLGYTVKG